MLHRRQLSGAFAAVIGAAMVCAPGLSTTGHAQQARAPIPLETWIGLTGPAQELLISYGEAFNKTQNDYKMTVVFKGQYPEQRAAAIAAFRAGNPPHLMQMFDAGTGDMMGARKAVVPVSEVFQRAGMTFDPKQFLAPAAGYYGLSDGSLLSMPLNVSTAVMFYNKDAFKKAGLNPDQPPKTWPELIDAAKKLRAGGSACGFTTTWLAWIMLEQMSALHDLPLSTKANGRDGLDATLNFNDPLRARIVQTLADLQKDKSFDYGGRSNDAAAKFISGECGILLQSSGGHAQIARDGKFEFGVSDLPYFPDAAPEGKPRNSIVGGASLWVFNAPNRSADEFKGVARFLAFLSEPARAADFAKQTGFLPATNAAFDIIKGEGFFEKNAGRQEPVLQLMNRPSGPNSWGYRFGRWTEIRDFYHEEVERVLQGQQSAQTALDNAVKRGNEALRQFERVAAN
jgi:sn-glycerol 3-phosphate transport system substrate-binding protein